MLLTAKDQILQPAHKDYNNVLAQKIQKRLSKKDAEKLWSIILLTFCDEVVDPTIPTLIHDTEAKGIKVLGLTNLLSGSLGNIPSMEDWTINRLQKHGINLEASWRATAQKQFTHLMPKEPNRFARFKGGILFASGLEKGKVLEAFLHYVKMEPRKIIFIDDKLNHLESVQAFCSKRGIEFKGFQYTAVKNRPHKPLNKKRAEYEFEVLEKKHRWLNDREVDKLLMYISPHP